MLARRRAFAALILIPVLCLFGCTPAQVSDVLADQGVMADAPTAEGIAAKVNDGPARWQAEVDAAIHHPRLICVRYYESDKTGGPHIGLHLGNPHVPNSQGGSAGGFYQWINSSWMSMDGHRGVAELYGFPQYAHTNARLVPPDVQHVVTIRYVRAGGWAWHGDPC